MITRRSDSATADNALIPLEGTCGQFLGPALMWHAIQALNLMYTTRSLSIARQRIYYLTIGNAYTGLLQRTGSNKRDVNA
ncbi:hypothetical protein F384_00035 [Citrobacter amalonaticus Y19]|uniref:Uncharacterized protein n=1 Tax=Citrobacter amalonaticus Y19 TaxID=1261127 RepID=A0A0F6RDS2_CITAM|nr:hypothetical protein F384_00035 [Citrobacter amalonaticus Y19]